MPGFQQSTHLIPAYSSPPATPRPPAISPLLPSWSIPGSRLAPQTELGPVWSAFMVAMPYLSRPIYQTLHADGSSGRWAPPWNRFSSAPGPLTAAIIVRRGISRISGISHGIQHRRSRRSAGTLQRPHQRKTAQFIVPWPLAVSSVLLMASNLHSSRPVVWGCGAAR